LRLQERFLDWYKRNYPSQNCELSESICSHHNPQFKNPHCQAFWDAFLHAQDCLVQELRYLRQTQYDHFKLNELSANMSSDPGNACLFMEEAKTSEGVVRGVDYAIDVLKRT